jgi:MerR family transcriptional regulator, redox-sensitive transcriptional activator SoxR
MSTSISPAPAGGPLSEPPLTVGDLARAAGVAPSAVRFYENHGLINGFRTPGNQRRFQPVDVCLVKIIRVAQRVGLSVAEIHSHLADLPRDSRDITLDDFLRLRHRLEREARDRIEGLTAVLDDLTAEGKLCEVPPRS